MHPFGQLIPQNGIDHPLAFDSGFASKSLGFDNQVKMAFPLGVGPSVTRMEVGLVLQLKNIGGEGRFQFLAHVLGYFTHELTAFQIAHPRTRPRRTEGLAKPVIKPNHAAKVKNCALQQMRPYRDL